MPHRVSAIVISANENWKITNEVPEDVLFDAAMRIVMRGGDPRPGEKGTAVIENQEVINLRGNHEIPGQNYRGETAEDRLGPLLAPTARFAKFVAVDREEIEVFRSIESLLRDYIDDDDQKKPLSLAVFGPPGSGKSFGVTQVAESVIGQSTSKTKIETLNFNLAQMAEPSQLLEAFLQVGNASTSGSVPVAFFDEFDSACEGVNLGWLRYFLSPMQDGEFLRTEGARQRLGRAILVFAGGTCESFQEFSREKGKFNSETSREEFKLRKGPDFVSRLSGSINILGVNRREEHSDQSYLLRRAMIIRAFLIQKKLIGRTREALIDGPFLESMLKVSRYKHGARSIEKIMDMCIGREGRLHLPPGDQLAMHIEKADVDLLLRGPSVRR